MEIKICGIRRKEDIDIISKYKPDYIGFIFAKSKREVTPETVAEITKNLDKDIKKVGVFVNATYEKINEAVQVAKLDVVQLHGDENDEYISNLDCKCEIWKAVRVRDGEDIYDVKGVDRLLLDKYTDKEYGGSGRNIFRADRKFLAEDDECCDHQKVGQRRRQGPCQNVRDKVALDPVFVRH